MEWISKRMATRVPDGARYWWVSPIDPKLNQWGRSSTNSKGMQWCGWLRLLVGPGNLIVWVFPAFFVVPMSYECGAQLVGRILGSSRFNDICKSVKTIAVRGSLIKVPNKTKTIVSGVKTRAVESESREVGKSLKIG